MTGAGEMSPGEIARTLDRIEKQLTAGFQSMRDELTAHAADDREVAAKLATETHETADRLAAEMQRRDHALRDVMTAAIGPISTHAEQIKNLKERQDGLEKDLRVVTKQANAVSGIAACLAVGGSWFMAWFKQ